MILTVNAGSSSLKFALFSRGLSLIAKGQVTGAGETAQAEMLKWLAAQSLAIADVSAIGHRIVHGGTKYVNPTQVDDAVLANLEAMESLAPLHLPFGVDALRRLRNTAPAIPHIACFDTAFHATQPVLATRLPLPRAYFDKGYRRYGFHGLSYEHLVDAIPKPLPRRLLAAHLGSGASMCAIVDGRSVATTMGYSTADGLVMGTRTGSLDPGVIIALMRDEHMSVPELEDLLYRKSGLLGLSGISADMRTLLASPAPEAREAIDYYCYSVVRHAGSLIAAMGGIDAIAFTGGIGENAPDIRARVLAQISWLGSFAVHVIPADEERVIARYAHHLSSP